MSSYTDRENANIIAGAVTAVVATLFSLRSRWRSCCN